MNDDAPIAPGARDPAEEHLRRQAKAVLRKRLRGLRGTFPASSIAERSARVAAALEALEVVREAREVALFWPIEGRNEVDLRALDASLRARGVRVAYPAVDRDAGEMSFRLAAPEDLDERGSGFREPALSAPEAAPDVVVCPALAIDERGFRLGYGRGFYDRALGRLAPPAVAVGVAFSFQLMPDLPDTEGDVPVAWIVTDEGARPASR
jgi:5-formyltetrahydrofolate cyclo-ligase